MPSVDKYCIIIPCYEKHALILESVLSELSKFNLPFIIIDDGSSEKYAQRILKISEVFNASLIVNKKNGGKGSAMKLGFKYALDQGFSHGLQVDADGQHDTSSLRDIINLSKVFPEYLISGTPVYDESIPNSRKWGRYITHFWVWIETLGFALKDSMCGFRSYPLASTVSVINNSYVGNRMDFDTEIMVKLYWKGIPSNFVPINVIYPEDGESYFDLIQDNISITKMHTRLFFGMLLRFPLIIVNKFRMKGWSQIDEKGVVLLIRFTSLLQDKLGKNLINLVVRFICFYYYLFVFSARKSSSLYKDIYIKFCDSNRKPRKNFSSYSHIFEFGKMMLDKFSVWKGNIKLDQFDERDLQRFKDIKKRNVGALFISSHFGNIELIRALGRADEKIKYNSLIYTKNSKKLFSILKQVNHDVEDKIIVIEEFNPEIGVILKEKAERGEWLFCMGDRVTANSRKTLSGKLLGEQVELPMGPLIISYLLDVPVFSIHCFRDENKFRIQCREITPNVEKTRRNRSLYLNRVAEGYLADLENVIVRQPKQWFNFYNFWKDTSYE